MDCLNNLQFYEDIKTYTSNCFQSTFDKKQFIQYDEKLNDFLEKIDKQYNTEISPIKFISLEYLANVVEKIQFLCWLLALKKHDFCFSMSKNFLRTSVTGLFRFRPQQNTFHFDKQFSGSLVTYIKNWENIMINLTVHIFQENSITDIYLLLFKNPKFRAVIIGCYFTYKLCTM